MTELKAFADDKLNVNKMTISLSDRVENTEGKGENAGYQHFLIFPSVFSKAFLAVKVALNPIQPTNQSLLGVMKSWDRVVKREAPLCRSMARIFRM